MSRARTHQFHEYKDGETYRPVRDGKGRIVVTDETFDPRKGDLGMEGTTKRRFGLGDSIRTLRAGR